MKTRTILCSIAIASLGFGSLAQAQPQRHEARKEAREDAKEARKDHKQDQRAGHPGNNGNRGNHGNGNNGNHGRNDRHDARHDQRDARHDHQEARRYYNARSPEFRRGGRLPQEMRDRQYVVHDWRGHRLAPPPRGQQWVQVGPDYVLTAIATGIILNMVLNQ